MKLAIISTPDLLKYSLASDYHLCLARQVLANPKYANFYRELSAAGQFVIMDNGAAEEGTLEPDQLWAAARWVKPNEVVMPDVVNDYEGTCALVGTYRDCPQPSMVVPQGLNVREWLNCLMLFSAQASFVSVGISKYSPVERRKILQEIEIEGLTREWEYHLLGVQHDPQEIKRLSLAFPWIRGVDTGAAQAYAQNYCSVAEYGLIGHVSLRWEDSNTDDSRMLSYLKANIETLKLWANAH